MHVVSTDRAHWKAGLGGQRRGPRYQSAVPSPRVVLAAVLATTTGCDYTFVTFVNVEVLSADAPVAGAWVLACGHAARTDAAGVAAIERADFLGGPCQTPVLVVAPGMRPSATLMENASGRATVTDAGAGCGGPPDGVEETWTARVELFPLPTEPGSAATCDAERRCTATVPALSSGEPSLALVVTGGPDLEPRLVTPTQVEQTPVGAGSLRVDFTVPPDVPDGASAFPLFTWHRVVAFERDGQAREGTRPRDAVATFGDAIVVGAPG